MYLIHSGNNLLIIECIFFKVLKAKSEVGCNLCTVVTTYLDDVIGSESTKV